MQSKATHRRPHDGSFAGTSLNGTGTRPYLCVGHAVPAAQLQQRRGALAHCRLELQHEPLLVVTRLDCGCACVCCTFVCVVVCLQSVALQLQAQATAAPGNAARMRTESSRVTISSCKWPGGNSPSELSKHQRSRKPHSPNPAFVRRQCSSSCS